MREFKFRVWTTGWFSGKDQMIYLDNFKEFELVSGSDELMQYTGLKDKNGNEIWEGDILKIHEGDNWTWIHQVEYYLGSFMVTDENSLSALHSFSKVIGNIYENPELLVNNFI